MKELFVASIHQHHTGRSSEDFNLWSVVATTTFYCVVPVDNTN